MRGVNLFVRLGAGALIVAGAVMVHPTPTPQPAAATGCAPNGVNLVAQLSGGSLTGFTVSNVPAACDGDTVTVQVSAGGRIMEASTQMAAGMTSLVSLSAPIQVPLVAAAAYSTSGEWALRPIAIS